MKNEKWVLISSSICFHLSSTMFYFSHTHSSTIMEFNKWHIFIEQIISHSHIVSSMTHSFDSFHEWKLKTEKQKTSKWSINSIKSRRAARESLFFCFNYVNGVASCTYKDSLTKLHSLLYQGWQRYRLRKLIQISANFWISDSSVGMLWMNE